MAKLRKAIHNILEETFCQHLQTYLTFVGVLKSLDYLQRTVRLLAINIHLIGLNPLKILLVDLGSIYDAMVAEMQDLAEQLEGQSV